MKIIYADDHRRHAPLYQVIGGELRPYPEVPERVERILKEVGEGREVLVPLRFSMDTIRAVHDADYLFYMEKVYAAWIAAGGGSEVGLIPDTFAMRTLPGRPEDLVFQAGYYCFETQTPVMEQTWEVVREAAFCALTGAALLLEGEAAAYALCRPPGHHAAGDVYGGYCYLNHAAIAAKYLSVEGRVAVLDVDYHHGNGTQAIFYDSDAVLFVSIHADPNGEYPYFSGFAGEMGAGAGRGLNVNLPLQIGASEVQYLETLDRALAEVYRFDPAFLVVSLGVDICAEDPLGKFHVPVEMFVEIGRRIARLKKPTLLVQEGGYDLATIGGCVQGALEGVEGVLF